MATGIDAASSTYACIWCKCSAGERWDTSKQWSLDDAAKDGSRTIEENMAISALPKTKKKFNVSNPPLFPTIPLSRVVIDNLHLFLRVSDVLIDLLVEDAMRLDSYKKMSKLSNIDRSKVCAYNSMLYYRAITSAINMYQ